MLNKKMLEKLNAQLNREYSSSYIYLAMSTWCASKSFDGSAAWLRIQAQEELGHALKFVKYIEDQGHHATLRAIDEPQAEFDSLREVFEKTLEHEQFITKSIHELFAAATAEKDYPTQSFLKYFIDEQVEEEANASQIVDRLEMAGDSKGALLYLDKDLGKRAKG
jgi:ferritin